MNSGIPGIQGDKVDRDTDALAENIPMLNDLNTYKDEELIKFVNGTRSFDTWDQFLEECDGIGLRITSMSIPDSIRSRKKAKRNVMSERAAGQPAACITKGDLI